MKKFLIGILALGTVFSAQTAFCETIAPSALAALLTQHANDRAYLATDPSQSSGIRIIQIVSSDQAISFTVEKLSSPGYKCFDVAAEGLEGWYSKAPVTYTVVGPFNIFTSGNQTNISSPPTAGKTSFLSLSITYEDGKPFLGLFGVEDTKGNSVDCYVGGK